MDLTSRIRRRQRDGGDSRLVVDHDAISPVVHVEEPTGRGPVLERLLDYVEPTFDGRLPPNAYVSGPAGAGKSAVVTALFSQLSTLLSQSRSVIHTSTRARSGSTPSFVYVDARGATSDFALYHDVLSGVVDETVPRQGIGTESLLARLTGALGPDERSALVAVDHLGEPETFSLAELVDLLEPVGGSLRWVAIGRTAPEEVAGEALPPERIDVPQYDQHTLVDVVTERASVGLAGQALEHEETRQLAAWAEGDAHDALAALFGAADRAAAEDRSKIHHDDLSAGMNHGPRPSVSLGRVLALSENRRRVLRALVGLEEASRESVEAATDAIAASGDVALSRATIRRFLYELAEAGITERVAHPGSGDGLGRPPSRLEPRFPTLVFERLYDLQGRE
jgi:Cdc6-like AAA superfamily ATPase